jgi:hypothetical protein
MYIKVSIKIGTFQRRDRCSFAALCAAELSILEPVKIFIDALDLLSIFQASIIVHRLLLLSNSVIFLHQNYYLLLIFLELLALKLNALMA